MALKQPERLAAISKANPSSAANSSFISALYLAKYGRTATAAEQAKFAGKTVKDVSNLVLGASDSPFYGTKTTAPISKNQVLNTDALKKYTKDQVVTDPKTNAIYLKEGVKPIAGTTKTVKTTTPVAAKTTPQPVVPATPPTYEDWLKGAGKTYANLFTDATLAADFNPYFQKQQQGLDYEKTQAYGNLDLSLKDYERQTSQSYNDNRGLFGSGVYQQDLQRELANIRRPVDQYYAADPLSPYSQRKFDIEQAQKTAIEQARIQRQGQSFQAYSTQFYPQFLNQ